MRCWFPVHIEYIDGTVNRYEKGYIHWNQRFIECKEEENVIAVIPFECIRKLRYTKRDEKSN